MCKNIFKNSFVLLTTVFCVSGFFPYVNTAFAFVNQTITVSTSAPTSAVYGDSFSVSATTSSGLVVAITTIGGCFINGEIVTMTSGVIPCAVHYNQSGDESFNPALEIIETTTATKRPITVTAVTNTKAYDDGILVEVRPIILSGVLASGDREEFREKYDNKEVGIGKILTPSAVIRKGNTIMNGNYSITLVPIYTGVIDKATPIVIWNTPNDITLGAPLGVMHQNATASVPGTFVYTEASGTILPPGLAQIISVNFTPDDTEHYNNVMGATVLINVIRGGGSGGLISSSASSSIPTNPAVPGVSPAIPAIPAVPASKVLGASTGPIPGCGNRTTGFSVASGQSCATNLVSQVLGAEKFVFTKLMRNGSKGDEVMELQNFLITAGYNPGIADGIFGNKSKAALIKFQIANKLKGDGVAGPLTHAVLNK